MDFHKIGYVALGTPAHHSFYGKVKFCNVDFSVGKVKKVDYSETIAACGLKLIDLMRICEY